MNHHIASLNCGVDINAEEQYFGAILGTQSGFSSRFYRCFWTPPPLPTCPIKSQLQHVNSSTVFPQVLMPPPLGEAAKLKMDADNRGGVHHWVVGSKSTPAREAGTKMMKFHLPPNHTPPTTTASNLFHLPFPPTLIHLYSLPVPYLPGFHVSRARPFLPAK